MPLKPCISLQPLDFKSNCDSSDFLLDFCFVSRCRFDLLRKCGLLAHTSAAFLKNCCTEKLSVACGLLLGNDASRETDLPHPAKGGSTPAFAYQRAAIAPLPCLNLQLVSQRKSNCELASFKECNCSRKNLLQNNLLRKCGLLAHTSAAFLKNCCTEKLSVACGLLLGNDASRETDLPHPAKGGSTPAFAYQRAAIAPLPCLNLQLVSQRKSNCELASFKECNCSRKNLLQNNLLRKCGLLAHTSAAFLKNCCIEKLFSCLRLGSCSQRANSLFPSQPYFPQVLKKWLKSGTPPPHLHIYTFSL